MAIIKKNIWLLFYIILFSALILLSSLIYKLSIDTKDSYLIKQENTVNLKRKSLESILLQYESVLNLLGNQLTQNENYKSPEEAREILDNFLKLNPSLGAFGLAKPNGQLYVVSSNLKNITNLPNLLEDEETKDTFAHTLTSSNMVLGRTYLHKTLNSLIIPIRKSILDENNNVVAVMTAGININKSFGFLSEKNSSVMIIRGFDNYRQFTPYIEKDYDFYKKPFEKEFVEKTFKKIEEEYKISMEEIRDKEFVISFETKKYDSSDIISSTVYLKKYELWIASHLDIKLIQSEILKYSIILILIFIAFNSVIYYLFKKIDEYEKKKNDALKHQLSHDFLTNLNNRYYLSEKYEKLDKENIFYLFFIDIDNFKSVNDNYGHDIGDKVLKEIANRLNSFKNYGDDLVRYSGDEFLFISYETDFEEIKLMAQAIINKLYEPYLIKQYTFILGSSIGISQFPKNGTTFDEIKRYADIAMYESKIEKNKYTIFNEDIKNKYLEKALIEQELKYALAKNEIYMMYQPQVDINGSLYGVEALVRWENKKLGFVPPDKFIKIAEEIGLMGKLGSFVIETSLAEIKNLQNEMNIDFHLSINISVKQFMEVKFYEELIKCIEKTKFDKAKITLEITENIFINDVNYILSILNKLRKNGICISMDDFGTGYSSLSLLKKLPIDELKIDKSFVDDIIDDKNALSMVTSIITIAKNLDMVVLAEGVEKLKQKEILESYGCNLFQGYYYSKPLKIEDLKYFVESKN